MVDERATTLEPQVRQADQNDRGAGPVHMKMPEKEAGSRRWLPRVALPSIGLGMSERKLLLAIFDVGLLIAALVIAVRARTDWLESPNAFLALWRWWVTLGVVWWLVAQLLEAYELARAASAPHSMLSAMGAAALTSVVYQMIPFLTPPLASRGQSVFFALLAVAFVGVWRGIYAVLFVQPNFEVRGLVLGAGVSGQALVDALSHAPLPVSPEIENKRNPYRGTGYDIIGFVDDDEAKLAAGSVAGIPVLGPCTDLPSLAKQMAVDEVVLAITHRHAMSDCAFDALLTCREQGIHVTTMPALYERLLGRVPVYHIGRNLTAVLPADDGGPMERVYWLAKRWGDTVLAAIGVLPLGLLIPLVALANAIFSPGPLFYRQTRVGKAGRLFDVIKFRTMRPDAEKGTGAVWATSNDSRVTPVGRFLRKARLDELPQLLNVLRGEMSIIGPRPERPEFIARLAGQIPFYRARHAVRPGLTGWAQVRYGYGSSVEDSRVKLEYDLYYVRHASFYLDALITLKTVGVMLRLQGK